MLDIYYLSYLKLVNLLSKQNFFGSKFLNDYIVKIYYKYFGGNIKQNYNYNFVSKSFNRNYFWKNLLKNYVFFNLFLDNGILFHSKIIDIGCGAAPSTICFSYLKSMLFNNVNNKSDILLLDKSIVQLQIAKNILDFLNISYNYSILNTDYCEFMNILETEMDSLFFMSYFICENNFDIFFKHFTQKPINFFGVIDYKKNIDKFCNFFGSKFIPIYLNETVPNAIAELISDNEINIYGGYFSNC